ncbi:predicted protein [Gemella morbillorum M424]|nr:predicted protein [Gemella morbillorum M424]EFV35606.1 predicted protein [Gemella morbillorum M424]
MKNLFTRVQGRRTKRKSYTRLSSKGRTEDALALGAEEGRDKRRNATGSCK